LSQPRSSKPGDELLMVVSARQRMSWRSLRDAFDVLHARAVRDRRGVAEPALLVRQRSLRLLSELGHVELLPYGGSAAICAAPTAFAVLPWVGLPTVCLCGSRSMRAAETLREACLALGGKARLLNRSHPFSGGYAPAAIAIEATDFSVLKAVSAATAIAITPNPPAWRILRSIGSIADYEQQLDWNADPDPHWPRRDFDMNFLAFGFQQTGGAVRLSAFQDPTTRRQIHRIWCGSQVATVDRDWGRWLLLRNLKTSTVLFDEGAQALGIPVTMPLPGLLGRALALFAGLAPLRMNEPSVAPGRVDVYTHVPREAAELLCSRLGQSLVRAQLVEG
jgi:hypothetical protein